MLSKTATKLFLLLISLVSASTVFSAPITLEVNRIDKAFQSGEVAQFSGTITNRSGITLESTDLFLNFNAFDFNSLTPFQDLGESTFSLPNFTFISNVALFSIEIAPTASDGIYGLQVFLSDINGNLSDPSDIQLLISNVTQEIAEPPAFSLALLAIGLMAGFARRGVRAPQGIYRGSV